MSLFFCARLLAPLMGLVLAGQGAAMAETVRARYSVSLIGLHIGEATAHGSIEQANYKIELNARLTGVASWVAHVRMALQSSGFIRRSTVLPSAYATSSANEHMTRTLRMALNAGNVRAVEITPPFMDMDGRVPVSAANKRNILDPISALIMAVPAGESLVGPAACNRTLPIYDGVIRFDLTMSYVRTQQVAGPAIPGPCRSAPSVTGRSPAIRSIRNRRASWHKTARSKPGSRRSRAHISSCRSACSSKPSPAWRMSKRRNSRSSAIPSPPSVNIKHAHVRPRFKAS
jgi:NAD(P)-dependent dehydrogenase (short-subunit alcohol dehydrogenase family)